MGRLRPLVGLVSSHALHEVGIRVVGELAEPGQCTLGRRVQRDRAHHDPVCAEPSRDSARIYATNGGDTLGCQKLVEGRSAHGVTGSRAVLPDREAGHLDTPRLKVPLVNTVVADERVRGENDLAGIRRVGEHLLVTGHRRVEDDLTEGLSPGAKCTTTEHRTVLKYQ